VTRVKNSKKNSKILKKKLEIDMSHYFNIVWSKLTVRTKLSHF